MSDYIERDAAKQMINRWADGYSYIEVPTEWAEDEVRKIPTADVVPVVRCRDCTHYEPFREHDGFCKIDGMLNGNDHFCAYGERKGGDER